MKITDIKEIKITCIDEKSKEREIILNYFVNCKNPELNIEMKRSQARRGIGNELIHSIFDGAKININLDLECDGFNIDFGIEKE